VPHDEEAVMAYYRGQSTLYHVRWLEAWAFPVLTWGAFLFLVFWVLLCATSLVRRHWIEHERLTFPLVELPLRMTDNDGAFWRSRAMWVGFAVAGILESVNFIAYLYPNVPSIPLKPINSNALDLLITTPPWNSVGAFRIAFYPWVIGLGFLLALDVSFSCWFFYLCTKVANIASVALGYVQPGGTGPANRAPYLREQSLGAFIGLAIFALWMARGQLKRMLNGRERAEERNDDEMMSGRIAVGGGLVGVAGLVGFLVAVGVPAHAAGLFVLAYVCIAITLARIVSEAGAGWAFAPNWTPTAFAADTIGPDQMSHRNLVALHGMTRWMGDMRDNPMPQQVQATKLGYSTGMRARAMLIPLLWAAGFAILMAFWAHLDIYYRFGAASAKVRSWPTGVGIDAWEAASAAASSPTRQDLVGLLAAGVGAAIAIALAQLRLVMPVWPFHPLGFAVAMTNSMDYMWFPFFLAWLAKRFVLRYGGVRVYRAALPFALGMILGDYVVPAIWGLYGMISGTQQYMVFPH
jgi:hypothetical protein